MPIPDGTIRDDALILAGRNLSQKQVDEIEQKLKKNPETVDLRLRLLGFYWTGQFRSRKAAQARAKHVFWMINNRPADYVTGSPWCSFRGTMDDNSKLIGQAEKYWIKAIDGNPDNAAVLANAAWFFKWIQEDRAEDLLCRAKSLEPKNPEWPRQLSSFFLLKRNQASKLNKRIYAGRALVEDELWLKLQESDYGKFLRLAGVAWTAFHAGEFSKAKKYANQLLRTAKNFPGRPLECEHAARHVLGCVCLVDGDTEAAKKHLLASLQLDSSDRDEKFIPDMTLAKLLLERGQKRVVLKYLRLCVGITCDARRNCLSAQLERWYKTVKAGGIPRFKVKYDDYVRR